MCAMLLFSRNVNENALTPLSETRESVAHELECSKVRGRLTGHGEKILQGMGVMIGNAGSFTAYTSKIRHRIALVRLGLIAVLFLAISADPSVKDCYARQCGVLGLYAAFGLAGLFLNSRRRQTEKLYTIEVLLGGVIDVAAIVFLEFLSDGSPFLALALFVVPLISAFHARPRCVISIIVLAFGAFLILVSAEGKVKEQVLHGHAIAALAFFALICTSCAWFSRLQLNWTSQIAELSEDRKKLLADVMSSEQRERASLSEALHDGPMQDILVLRFKLLETLTHEDRNGLVSAHEDLLEISRQLRGIIRELHPAVLQASGLGAALRSLVDHTAMRTSAAAQCDINYVGRNEMQDAILFGVARELLSNIARHSECRNFSVRLTENPGYLVLEVEDDGRGTNAAEISSKLAKGHIGLACHRSRVESAAGSLEFPIMPRGTRVVVTVPIAPPSG